MIGVNQMAIDIIYSQCRPLSISRYRRFAYHQADWRNMQRFCHTYFIRLLYNRRTNDGQRILAFIPILTGAPGGRVVFLYL